MPETNDEGIIKLSKEETKKLDDLQVDIERGEKAVGALKEMGINVKEIEERIEWAKTAREVLIRDFS